MTNHDSTGQPVTFTSRDLFEIFTALAAMAPVIARAQGAWTQETRDAVAKAYSLVTFGVDGTVRIEDGRVFAVNLTPPPTGADSEGN